MVIQLQQQNINLIKLLVLNEEKYKEYRSEVTLYFDRYKGKKIFIYTIDYDPLQLAYECIYKIKPILNFIIIRNMKPLAIDIASQLLNFIDSLGMEYYVKRLSTQNDYGKCILEKRLLNIITQNNNDIRYLISFMFNMQPMKERKVSQNTVGFGKEEFDTVEGEE